MASLRYIKGDATSPQGPGPKIICHCCNDIGQWGSGFVVALSKRWSAPESRYRKWYSNKELEDTPFELGQVLFVQVEPDTWVANIIGQHRNISVGEAVPVRYEALAKGFTTVRGMCQQLKASAHMPRIGAGLARGDWSRIEKIIRRILVDEGSIDVTVYDL